jgi:hypothetical protein
MYYHIPKHLIGHCIFYFVFLDGENGFPFQNHFFIPLQVQSNLDKSLSDNRELKKISGEIFRCTRRRNDENSSKFAIDIILIWFCNPTSFMTINFCS